MYGRVVATDGFFIISGNTFGRFLPRGEGASTEPLLSLLLLLLSLSLTGLNMAPKGFCPDR